MIYECEVKSKWREYFYILTLKDDKEAELIREGENR